VIGIIAVILGVVIYKIVKILPKADYKLNEEELC
jgi:hypothetical protein